MTGTYAVCLHRNQSRSYLNHLVFQVKCTVISRHIVFKTVRISMCDFPFLAVSLLVYQTFYNLGKLGYVLRDERRNCERRWKSQTLKTKQKQEVLTLWEYFKKTLHR